jgi:hypothetical protein
MVPSGRGTVVARELRLDLWCDGEHGDEDVPATVTRTLTLDSGEPYLLDLCERCDKAVQDIALLMQRGVLAEQAIIAPGSTPPRKKGPLVPTAVASKMKQSVPWRTCPDCGYVTPTRSALGQHVKQKHEKLLRDYDWPVD